MPEFEQFGTHTPIVSPVEITPIDNEQQLDPNATTSTSNEQRPRSVTSNELQTRPQNVGIQTVVEQLPNGISQTGIVFNSLCIEIIFFTISCLSYHIYSAGTSINCRTAYRNRIA